LPLLESRQRARVDISR